LLLTVLCAGGTLEQAAKEIGASSRAVERYREKHPDFADLCVRAKKIAKTNDPDAIEAFLREAVPEPGSDIDPSERVVVAPVQIVPAAVPPVFDAEVMPGPPPEDPDLLVPGLPPLTERNLLAFHWRTMHDVNAPSGLRSACTRALHEHTLTRAHQRRLLQMDPGMQRRAPARELGLTKETNDRVRRAIIGPPPRKRVGAG
jgi:hypothetical protein